MIYEFNDIYVVSSGVVVGPLEMQGPLASYFDEGVLDEYVGQKSYEQAEQQLLRKAIDYACIKANIHLNEINIACGGDLLNQLSSCNYVMKDCPFPFVGMYAACATSSLIIGMAALLLTQSNQNYSMAALSSHYASAQRQFRYPNGYGMQKKATMTTTVSAGCALLLGKLKTDIKVKQLIVGKVYDSHFQDVNDMGSAMVHAVYYTLTNYLKETNASMNDFDLIVSGDLSNIGLQILKDLLKKDGYQNLDHLYDCGLMIYDIKKQKVFSGGSGCGCSMAVSLAYLFQMMKQGKYKRILVLASGALLTPILSAQKQSIPCICHGIIYERS